MGKRIYISGPITNNPNYVTDFLKAELNIISHLDWPYTEIINPVSVSESLPDSFKYEDYMTIDMILLTRCDAIYMLRGYEKSKGAIAELLMAKNMGLEIIYESEEQNEQRLHKTV